MNENAIASLFLFFATATIIIVAAYYVTRAIGKKTSAMSRQRKTALLEKSVLPGNLVIQVVKVADCVYVLATQGKEITTLDKFTVNEWEEMKLQSDERLDERVTDESRASWFSMIISAFKDRNSLNGEGFKKGD